MFIQPSNEPLTDAELDELGDLLLDHEEGDNEEDAEDAILGIDELHGFLTAVVCAPSMIMPSEYLPRVFGDREWRSMEDAQRAMELLMRMYNEINADLRAGEFVPLFVERQLEDGKTVVIYDDWCFGFVRGMSLRPAEWMIADDKFQQRIFPIAAITDTSPDSKMAKWASENHDMLVELLPGTIQAIHDYLLPRRKMPVPAKTAPRIGRNDPCFCGSSKKYKKCCGDPGRLN